MNGLAPQTECHGTFDTLSWSLVPTAKAWLSSSNILQRMSWMAQFLLLQLQQLYQRSTNQGWLSSEQETGTGWLAGWSKSVSDEGSIHCPDLSPLVQCTAVPLDCWHCPNPLIIFCHHRMLHLLHEGFIQRVHFYFYANFWFNAMVIGILVFSLPNKWQPFCWAKQ